MKKILLGTFALLTLAACEQEELVEEPSLILNAKTNDEPVITHFTHLNDEEDDDEGSNETKKLCKPCSSEGSK